MALRRSLELGLDLHRALALPPTVFLRRVECMALDPLPDLAWRLPPGLAAAKPRRQRDFLMGRYCAAAALTAAGCAGPTWLQIAADGLPAWPDGWLGSISHAADGAVAVAAASRSCDMLGLDMERVLDDDAAADVAHLVALDGEQAIVSALGRQRGLTLLFSAKEALYKALFPEVRAFFDFTAARAVALDDGRLTLRLTVPWGPRWTAGMPLQVRFVFIGQTVFTAVHAAATSAD